MAGLSIADLLAEPILAGAALVAGAAGEGRQVGDIRYLAAGLAEARDALVVCDERHVNPAYRLDALVRQVFDAGAAGILVVAEPGAPLLSSRRLADRLAFPVLWHSAAETVSLVQELTVLVRTPELIRVRTVEKLLQQLGSKRTGPDILAAAAAVLGERLSLLSPDGTPIVGAAIDLDPELRLEYPVAQRVPKLLMQPVLDPEVNRLAAWLACPYDRAAAARLDLLAVGLAMAEPYVRSWLSGQRAQSDRDTAYRSHLLSEIVAAGESVSRDLVEAAVSLGWQLQNWHVGLYVTADGSAADGSRGRLVAQLTAELDRHGIALAAMVGRSDGWTAWTSTEAEPAPAQARVLLRAARLTAAAVRRDWGLCVGIGRPHRGPGGLAETLSEARDAADLARSHPFRPAVEHSDELGVARLLATWQRSEVTRAFAESALGPLRDSPVLLATLRAYLEAGGSVVVAAQTLGVHRNTVTTRLGQIRERLGVELDDPNQRLALQVACRALGV